MVAGRHTGLCPRTPGSLRMRGFMPTTEYDHEACCLLDKASASAASQLIRRSLTGKADPRLQCRQASAEALEKGERK
jgi:hypothetical protein